MLDPELDTIQDVYMQDGNYTVYVEDEYWAPMVFRKAITADKRGDMHFGAGNMYTVWSFYGKIDGDGKFVHPEKEGFIANNMVTLYFASAYTTLIKLAGFALFILNA